MFPLESVRVVKLMHVKNEPKTSTLLQIVTDAKKTKGMVSQEGGTRHPDFC